MTGKPKQKKNRSHLYKLNTSEIFENTGCKNLQKKLLLKSCQNSFYELKNYKYTLFRPRTSSRGFHIAFHMALVHRPLNRLPGHTLDKTVFQVLPIVR